MKKYLLIIGVGALLLQASCDSLQQDETVLLSDQELLESDEINSGEENFRKKGNIEYGWKVEEAEKAYRFMENAYLMLPLHLPKEAADQYLRSSRSKEQFVEMMIKKSIRVFDGNLLKNGRFLSPLAKRNHGVMAGGEHEIEYDLTGFMDDEEAAIDVFIKFPDIPGESSGETFSLNYEKIKSNSASSSNGGNCDGCSDSIPTIKRPQLEKTLEFLKIAQRFNGEPSQTSAAFEDLVINAKIDPLVAALLLPAIQKAREAARIDGRGKADILIDALSKGYKINLENQKGKFLRYGGLGSIFELISVGYDEKGDLDWSSIQLNRTKFELEMLLFWSRFWDENQSKPRTGR